MINSVRYSAGFIFAALFLFPQTQLRAQFSFPASASPIITEVKETTPESGEFFELEILLKAEEGIHVYSTKDKFFELVDEKSKGLGDMKVILPERHPFTDLDGSEVKVFAGESRIRVRSPFNGSTGEPYTFEGYLQYQGCSDVTCFPPAKAEFNISGTIPEGVTASSPASGGASEIRVKKLEPYERGFFWGILGFFSAGVLLSLTPCVYPMIGITIAVIGGKKASRKHTAKLTFFYVFGLSLVYAAVGVAVAANGSQAADFFRSAWVILPISVIFILLGLSMFDILVLQTPSAITNKLQSVKGKGGVWSTFLTGAVSAFVVGPCISGPVIALIIYIASTGDMVKGFFYFFALAWGMGIILFVAGMFSGALPRAGMWMERVKHLLGVVLIWAAFYFARPFIGETAFSVANIVGAMFALKAVGLMEFPEIEHKWKGLLRLLAGVALAAGIVAYLLPEKSVEQGEAAEVDLELLLQQEKPVLLDFQAPWCTICKEIEETVLSKPEVKRALNDYMFVKVDFDSNEKLRKQFNIVGPPAFVFVNDDGTAEKIIVTGEQLENRLLGN